MNRIFIAFVIGVCATLFLKNDKITTQDEDINNLKFKMDSIEFAYQVNLCKFDSIIQKRDTITKVLNKTKVVIKNIEQVKPVYSTDSLTVLLTNLINYGE